MTSIHLDGNWKLYYYPQEEHHIHSPVQLRQADVQQVDAVVPGNVELDLVRAGELPDLFVGDNIHQLRPYELYEWWYEKEFATPELIAGKKLELVFHGVDCIATYWLNDVEIGRSDNMLIEHKFKVDSNLLKETGMNTLTVRLKSPILEAMTKSYEPGMQTTELSWERLWIRKAAHGYSWDIMPRAISAGLWRSVELIVHDDYEIADLYFYTTALDNKRARLKVYYQIHVEAKQLRHLRLQFVGKCGQAMFTIEKRIFFTHGTVEIEVPDPQLWWPRGYGEANLYEIETRLYADDRQLAVRQDRVGIRTAELLRTEVTSKERPGQFLFKVNGVPILVKGSNWVPADAFHSRDASRYEQMMELVSDLKCNMLRCWGGGVYEDHAFYDLCDKYGVMIWQDFAMANAFYPQEQSFWQAIAEEARAVINKLRQHTSIVLWSGDNEIDEHMYQQGLNPEYNRITREILPYIVHQCDPARPFLASSPYMIPEIIEKNDLQLLPEQHLWGQRDYYKGRFYTEATAHFIGEIGYHGCPNLSSIEQFIDKEHLWPWQDNEQWLTHCSDAVGSGGHWDYRIKLMADQITELFDAQPTNLEDFIIASQISQAEAKKYFIEMTRLKKFRRTGVLWWNVIDGWPQFSDAVVDYYYGKKLAYHYIKRVQEPVCIMVNEPDSWHVRVTVGNDSNRDTFGQYRVWDGDTNETLLEGDFMTKANENVDIGRIRVSRGEQRLFLMSWTIEGTTFGNHYLLGSPSFSLDRYKSWLEKIAQLPSTFDAGRVGK